MSFAHHHDALIVWDASKANISNKCIMNELKMGAGVVTRKNEKTFQLIDNAAQLEYFYQEKTDTICGRELHKLTNLDTAYLQISTVNLSIIYNVATGFCLTHDFGVAACNDLKRKRFTLVNNQIAIPSDNPVECTAYEHVSTEYFNFVKAKCGQTINFRWDGQSLHIVGIAIKPTGVTTGCLSADNSDTARIFFKDCDDSDTEKWIFGTPSTYVPQKGGGSAPLLIQHHQFMEHQAVVHDNILAENIRKMYCGNLQMRKHLKMPVLRKHQNQTALQQHAPIIYHSVND
jgi:hypothetical protein